MCPISSMISELSNYAPVCTSIPLSTCNLLFALRHRPTCIYKSTSNIQLYKLTFLSWFYKADIMFFGFSKE